MADTPAPDDMVFVRPASEPETNAGRVRYDLFLDHFEPQGFIVVDEQNQPVKDAKKAPAKPASAKAGD